MNTKPILLVSLLGNAALLLVAGLLLTRTPAPPPTPPAPAAGPAKGIKTTPTVKPRIVTITNEVIARKFDWRAVESTDYKGYIENLRAIGCPEETIRDIIQADINKLFEARMKNARGATNRFEYWKSGNPLANLFNEETIAKQQELAKEKRALLKELLGPDATEKPDLSLASNPLEMLLEFLPAQKQSQVMELQQKYAAKLMKTVKDASRGDGGEMRKVQQEIDREMLTVLTPDEKFEYDLRLSQSAMLMRMQMGDFETTEQEFRNLFKARKLFDDEYGLPGLGDAGKAQERAQAEKELNKQYQEVLGEQRYREYENEQTWSRSSLRTMAKEFDISKENAFKVFDLTDAAQQQADAVRANNALAREQKQAALDALRMETEKATSQILGQPAMEAYSKKGDRMTRLNRLSNLDSGK